MKNKIKLILSTLTLVFVFSSCLKDKVGDYWVDDLAGKQYATVVNYTLQSLPLQPVTGEVNFQFLVNIATDALPTEDITLTFAVDPTAVAQYNKDHGKSYLVFPTVQMVTPTLVIAKGTRNGYAKAKVWGAETLDACSSYMTALTITSAKTASGKDITIAGNMKSYLLSLPISNPYSADYQCIGYRIHPVNGVYTVNTVETCSTIDCRTVIKHLMGDYPYDVTINITSNTVVVKGVTCFKVNVDTLDPSNGLPVSSGTGMKDTFTGNTAYNPQPPTNDVNYYNPVTKQFVLNYFYNSAAPRITYEILTRQ